MTAMKALEGRRIGVLGGAGDGGEGICRVLLRQGARVGVPSRSADKLGLVARAVDAATREHLVLLQSDPLDPDSAAEVRDELVRALGGLDDVVVCIGGWWQGGPLLSIPLTEWTEKISRSHVLAHLVAARTWLPPLVENGGGSFLFINGGAALHAVANSGLVSMGAAAQLMLKDVLVAETEGSGVRINSLVLMTPILSRRLTKGMAEWLSNDEVGETVAHLFGPDGAHRHGESIELARHDQVPG